MPYVLARRTHGRSRNSGRARQLGWALLLAAALPLPFAPVAGAAPAPAAGRTGPSPLATIHPVTGRDVPHKAEPASRVAAAAAGRTAPAVSWPTPGSTTLTVPTATSGRSRTGGAPTGVQSGGVPSGGVPSGGVPSGGVPSGVPSGGVTSAGPAGGGSVVGRAGGLPVTVTGSAGARVTVQTLDRAEAVKAGVTGLLLRVTAAAPATVTVDYTAFAGAYGADWASRLRVLRLPDGTDVTAKADLARRQLTATVPAGPATTYALTAGASGSTGNYTATSLSPASSWDVSTQSGDFSWSYPISGPPVPGGLSPDLSIAYSSGAVDGRTASTNNQPSWVGDGHELWGGYIETGYRTCSDDGVAGSGDLCWAADNATLVLNGSATPLVRDDATGTWRPARDDGSTIERLTGAANGDKEGEYWRLTTVDGTQYTFGINRLPGWVTGKALTNSTWSVPVYSNNTGEPCHGATFAASSCTQAWRWNLDYVVDPHANAMAYYYNAEPNHYLANGTTSALYYRGGTLTRIDYGFRAGQAYTAAAPAQVAFTVADRCQVAGATCTTALANAGNWPDTPIDQLCSSACTASQRAPTFFSTKRLDRIDTQIISGGTAVPVDRWQLTQTWPDPGDTTSAALFLSSIVHTGLVGGSAAVPAVTFDGHYLPNRVDGLEGWPPLNKWRVDTIRSESGGLLEVNYAPAECDRAALPAAPDTNGKRCFAAWWTPPGQAPALDWFHKYVVRQTLDRDTVGGGRFTETDYDYGVAGSGAWHYPDADEVTPVAKRTWSSWRGYAKVTVTTGAGDDGPKTTTEQRFYRGMDGDKLTAGTRTATVTDSLGGTHPDSDGLDGFGLETRTLNGATEVGGTITDPYRSRTAAHGHDGRTSSAYLVRTAQQRGRIALASGTRNTTVSSTWDTHGNLTVLDDQGDTTVATDGRCTRTDYASNATTKMYAYPYQSKTVAVACAATPTYPRDAVSDTRTYYDGSTTLGALPGAGDVTRTDAAKSYTGSTPNYLTTAKATVDAYGREKTATDALNRTTTTAYTETGGLTTQTVVTDPKTYATTTTIAPARGLPTTTVDANARRTDLTYDPLGRLTQVWLPGRLKANNVSTPDKSWSYSLSRTAPAAVTAKSLGPNANYVTSYAIYDGLLRPRQTQSTAQDGSGRVLTDTTYDTRGFAVKSNAAYVAAGAAGTGLVQVNDNQVPGQTTTEYDGAGRPTASVFRAYGAEQWRATTAYRGDHVDVTPPAGGTATSTWTDARGRTSKLVQYRGGTPTGTADTTTYGWTGGDQMARMTDPAGNQWTWSYDVLGRQTGSTDPDKGATTLGYDDAGQLSSATDARGTTLAYTYDSLGRRDAEYLGSTSGTLLASWAYDTAELGKGLPASSTRYTGGRAYTTAISGYWAAGQPWGKTVTIPTGDPAEAGLVGTYNYRMNYKAEGSMDQLTLPITPGLPNESLTYGFTDYSQPAALQAGLAPSSLIDYVPGATHDAFGRSGRVTLNSGGATAWLSSYYDLPTGRLSNTKVELGGNPTPASDAHYTYNPAGDVTSIADGADTQCFTRDGARRLTQAWTPASGSCVAGPTVAGLGGPAPYWQSYGYDLASGNRTSLVSHAAAGDTTTAYGYPAAGAAQPHTVRTAAVTGPGVSRTDTFGYDAVGNTTGRTVAGAARTLGWDVEGRLASVSGAASGSFIYDADGNRLIRKDASGSTLYLPEGVEVHVDAAGGNATSTRYYAFGGENVAVRTAAGVSFLGSDHHGTASVAVNAVSGAATVRRSDPFGGPRGGSPVWPGERGFVGGSTDTVTGLTHLGAREYDPGLGRFVSVDPLLDPSDPQQVDGYNYADANPVTYADPLGEQLCNTGPDGLSCHTSGGNVPLGGFASNGHVAGAPGVGSASGSGGRSSRRDAVIAMVEQAAHGVGPYHDAYVACGAREACVAKRYTPPPEFHGWPGHRWTLGEKVGWAVLIVVVAAVVCVLACPEELAVGSAVARTTAGGAGPAAVEAEAGAGRGRAAGRPAGRTAAETCGNSFTGETPVLMADGTRKPISEVKVGDKVKATDPETGETAARPVVAVIRHGGSHRMVDLTLIDGTVLHATDGHPIWDATTGRFTKAIHLRPGHQLLAAGDRRTNILATRVHTEDLTAYNLQIADIHTYYAGTTPTLVHNSCEPAVEVNRQFRFPGGGRGGVNVKSLVGPTNAVARGSEGRVFVTDGQGRVVLDITRDRVKPVVPGRGYVRGDGRKQVPTSEQLAWIAELWG